MTIGCEEGATCGRDGCEGCIEIAPPENCSCHIAPPCSACTAPRAFCPECDWQEIDDPLIAEDIASISIGAGLVPFVSTVPRRLDPTKIDFVSKPHSSCSMIKEGVYPDTGDRAADMAAVRKVVDGTFGGRFDHFGNGRFRFVAYTD